VEGVQQLSRNDFESMLQTRLDGFLQSTNALRQPVEPNIPATSTPTDPFRPYSWGGRFRPVPEDWKFPKGNVKAVCDLFMTGLPADNIRPFRFFKGFDLARKDQGNFKKAEYIFKTIKSLSVLRNMTVPLLKCPLLNLT